MTRVDQILNENKKLVEARIVLWKEVEEAAKKASLPIAAIQAIKQNCNITEDTQSIGTSEFLSALSKLYEKTDQKVYASIKKQFEDLGWEVEIEGEDIYTEFSVDAMIDHLVKETLLIKSALSTQIYDMKGVVTQLIALKGDVDLIISKIKGEPSASRHYHRPPTVK